MAQDQRLSAGASVAIVGGGLAGLAAACALSDSGYRVTLFERRPYLGGRASSYQHPGTGEVVDNCQHVLLGCCTNLLDFYRRTNTTDRVRWYRELVFIEPGGRQSVIRPSALPAPFHTAPSFMGASSLTLGDKFAISRAMLALAGDLPDDNGEPFLAWLQRHHQTPRAIERFWKVVLVSALNEDLDCVSSRYAAQVFRESFLKSAAAGVMGVPTVPLTDLYSAAGDYIQARGGQVMLRSSVESLRMTGDKVALTVGGAEVLSDYVVLAVPFNVVAVLLPEEPVSRNQVSKVSDVSEVSKTSSSTWFETSETSETTETLRLRDQLSHFTSSPITGIHLWFDREITTLENAVLLDRTIQWMFNKSRIHQRDRVPHISPLLEDVGGKTVGSYLELVVSSSKSLVDKSKSEIEELALRELAEFFPQVREAKLVKSTVIKEVHATYSPAPGLDQYRPPNQTPWPRLFLAGDWTATGWPATMEGAVRSGYLAAEALTSASGAKRDFLVPDLPASGLMKLMK